MSLSPSLCGLCNEWHSHSQNELCSVIKSIKKKFDDVMMYVQRDVESLRKDNQTLRDKLERIDRINEKYATVEALNNSNKFVSDKFLSLSKKLNECEDIINKNCDGVSIDVRHINHHLAKLDEKMMTHDNYFVSTNVRLTTVHNFAVKLENNSKTYEDHLTRNSKRISDLEKSIRPIETKLNGASIDKIYCSEFNNRHMDAIRSHIHHFEINPSPLMERLSNENPSRQKLEQSLAEKNRTINDLKACNEQQSFTIKDYQGLMNKNDNEINRIKQELAQTVYERNALKTLSANQAQVINDKNTHINSYAARIDELHKSIECNRLKDSTIGQLERRGKELIQQVSDLREGMSKFSNENYALSKEIISLKQAMCSRCVNMASKDGRI